MKSNFEKYGYFLADGNEFLIKRPDTPRHWYNYMWNNDYISFTSQTGFGESFVQDCLGRRISVVTGRNIYMHDEDSFWTANASAAYREYQGYQCVHGLGYTKIDVKQNDIHSSLRIFVPNDGTFEIWTVKLKNNRSVSANIKLIPYFSSNMDGVYVPQGYNTAKGFFDSEKNAAVGRNFCSFGSDEKREFFTYLTSDIEATGYDTRRNAFIGVYGNEENPHALHSNMGCTNSECIGEKLCFALENSMTLQSEEEREINYVIGVAFDKADIPQLTAHEINTLFTESKFRYSSQIEGVRLKTPDTNLNMLFNSWLKQQTNMGSRWARVRHNGFRDMVSDCECLSVFNPELAWERLKRVMSYQYSNGFAPRTFLDGKIQDKNFSDNTVWLTFSVYNIVKELGDIRILDEDVPFNDGTSASVYEHIKRSVEFLWNFKGIHGLIKLWGGDWNDCMNRAGLQGKGVSVWLSIAWYRANKQFQEIAELKGCLDDVSDAKQRGTQMKQAIEKYGWDGEYYLTAWTDWGTKVGSKENDEGKMFLIPQLWSVLSGVSTEDRQIKAIDAVEKYLSSDLGILVSKPSYTKKSLSIGSIAEKPAGVHENGGVYLHPATWKIAVDCMLKRNAKVEEGLLKLLPFHTEYCEKYSEPYVMCNSYFTEETGYRMGTPGQSWRSATGAWLTKALIQYVFGLTPEIEGLTLKPCLPPSWRECTISKAFRGSMYNISYRQCADGACNKINKIIVNGEPFTGEFLPNKKGTLYTVNVELTV